jgi:integrase
MSRPKRSHGDGTVRETKTGWQCEYRRQCQTFSKRDYPAKNREELLRNRAFRKTYQQWRDELDAKAERGPVVTMSQLFDKYLAQLLINKRSVYIEQLRVEKYLRPRLGHLDGSKFNLQHVGDYVMGRKQEKTRTGEYTSNGTINRELSIITSSLRLLWPEPRLLFIKKLDESDRIRQGIVGMEDYQLLLRELEDYQKPVWCFSYYTGVRRGQLLKLRREWTKDWETTGILEVPGWFQGERMTKNGKPHPVPIYSQAMREMLKWALQIGDPACPYLFQRGGKRISKSTFSHAFKRVARRVGRDWIVFHDLRRTAVTNMDEAGIPPKEAMAVAGMLTMSIYERYNIRTSATARKSVRATGEQMAPWHEKNFSGADYEKITRQNPAPLAPGLDDGTKPN